MRCVVLFLLSFICLIPIAGAHVPSFAGAGDTADTATVIDDATKSWALFDESSGENNWYRFDLEAGQQLYISVAVPPQQSGADVWLFVPGPDGAAHPDAPEGTTAYNIPANNNLMVEPFAVVAMRNVAEWRDAAPYDGTYFVLVRPAGTHHSMGVGLRETFTPVEWTVVPLQRTTIQSWGGVPGWLAFVGEALGFAAAAWLGWRIWRTDPRRFVGMLGAGAIGGTAFSVVLLAIAATWLGGWSTALVIPAVMAILALVIGWGAWRAVERARRRWTGVLWAVAALAAWAGFLLGPILLLAWAAWPIAQPEHESGQSTPATGGYKPRRF